MAEVRLQNISKEYGKRAVISNLSVAIRDGECFTLLGPSGCGKTVILRLIAGFERPSTGEIQIGNRLVASAARGMSLPPEERGIGVVFQDYAVWPHKTVLQNVIYPLQIQRLPKAEAMPKSMEAISTVGLRGMENRLPYQLSGGQQQRVALARALVSRPGIMLLDEPLNNLDANLREDMRFEIKELQRNTGVTILYVTHDQEVALALSDRIAIMDRTGAIRQIGTPEEIYEDPVDSYIFKFMGVSNFIPVDIRSGRAFVEKTDTPVDYPIPDGMRGGNRLVAGCRPSDIELMREPSETTGVVSRVTYLGSTFDYLIRLGASEIRVQQDTREALMHDLVFPEGATSSIRFHKVKWFRPDEMMEGVS
ncbi:MAG: ABC transporter ATP-binding protein [Clostridia bacterium]|nr:ABC transporter ATP-binding protein [Clostridia bacterium]